MIRRDDSGRYVGHDASNEVGYKRVIPGSFVVHLRSFQGGFAHSPIEGITSPAYTVFAARCLSFQSDRFWKHWFMSPRFIHDLGTVTYGIRDGRSINVDEFMDTLQAYPSFEEQKLIGLTLDSLDSLITLHQRKHDQLATLKKSLLDKMFPKPGSDVPELRFAGFTEPWEQRKLGELASEFQSGDFIPASDIADSGPYPVYGGNGLRGYTDHYNHDGLYALIGRQGALCGNVNSADGKAYFTEHAVAVSANESNDTGFMLYLLGRMNLGQYSGQSAQPGLAVGVLKAIETFVPDKSEQRAIGSLFARLDSLITLHQRKHDQLATLKKSLLDKMFV
ncbi:restriction endonuclease subunit S [Olsenella sp. YH-ols2223]|uniref:Restriction endonuclease subunit S n=1 Tax=Olsenella absiana TaxID=3115222 RepID=A0ABU7RBC3_9ACTN